ncbi:hypothetical protein PpBr36_07397 [Pyricularia pennisetigena]|uniref:hypothetical protein n=1 Tax=Pyricularia pennisetigena TaxID=1578925 RepID=UPI00115378BA|nr:hypothetical protein PpBr36_07397 [Pyricularia pennisetigena]TLS26034.1 hypothetical protein PpBr36_07397 [Pyricularia pennisetigena]
MHSDAGWRAADVMGEAVLEPQATSDGPRHYQAVRAGGYTTCTSVCFSDSIGGPRQCKCQWQPSHLKGTVRYLAHEPLAVHITLRDAVLSTPSWQGVLDYAVEAARKSSHGDIRLKIQYRMEHPIYHPARWVISKYLNAPHMLRSAALELVSAAKVLRMSPKRKPHSPASSRDQNLERQSLEISHQSSKLGILIETDWGP